MRLASEVPERKQTSQVVSEGFVRSAQGDVSLREKALG